MSETDRDLDERPYSADECRVCDFLQRLAPDLGCGNDPIGFLLESYEMLARERREALASQAPAPVELEVYEADRSAREACMEIVAQYQCGECDAAQRIIDAISKTITRRDRAAVAAERADIKRRLFIRLNDYLCEMREGYDDSIVGFNEAWDVMRKLFEDMEAAAIRARGDTRP